MSRRLLVLALSLSAIYFPQAASADSELAALRGAFAPLPENAATEARPIPEARVALGKRLYFETKLSKSGEISCNSCHQLSKFGVDNEPTSPGHKGQRGDRNSPTSYNAALHFVQFWDGRAADVEEQAIGPILNPVEMAMGGEKEVTELLAKDPSYVAAFKAAFPKEAAPLTYKNIGVAIGAFERTLLTPSRFDAFLKGDDNALTKEEIAGLKVFTSVGCQACHNGVGIGGGMYQKLGLVKPYPTEDLGRYVVTKNEADKYMFKVPGLRNITETGPYFHDGSVKTLPEAVKLMGAHQLGRDLSDEQVSSIITFLKSLRGTIPEEFRK